MKLKGRVLRGLFLLALYFFLTLCASSSAESYEFDTYEEALKKAKSIVEENIIQNYKAGMLPADMSSNYATFGEDPVIISEPWQDFEKSFSGFDYDKEFAKKYYKKKAKRK